MAETGLAMDVSCGHGKTEVPGFPFRGERDGFLWDCNRDNPVSWKNPAAKALKGSFRISS
jgi:hypothetical protein